ncbi:cytochrome b561 and DOMON domain-containing protein At3g07570 [Macadamia integrifolia]|uniref:cytochrome b561 and DOMON domain-containing protein At3g07570 n=1 Tax=Macadamia integrifolia TaxID=60698 RepID=UPI001C50013B|nr:cytochrome b561 and DOMON domain-containing protein At3g07570 [Macadamia integrifolia]
MREKRRDTMELQTSFISTFFFFFFLFLLSDIPPFVYSQSDSCSSNLNNLNGLVNFNTTSFHCQLVWDTEDYILRYLQSGPNLWSFVLSASYANSYIAMGFSKDGNMVGSSAMVGWASSDGGGVIKQYYLGGTTPSQVIPDQGKLSVVSNSSSIVYQSPRIYLAFQLKTTELQSNLIYSVGPSNWLPASDFLLKQHRSHISTSWNYVTGQSNEENPYCRLREAHGILNMMSWGILTIIGIIIGRYFRHWDPFWFYAHACIQSVAFILGFIGIILGYVLNDRLNANVSTHKGIGTFIFVLGCVQVMAFLVRPHTTSKVRKYWNWYHYSIGRILVAFAIGNIFYGIHLGNEGSSWNAGYGIILAILLLFAIALEAKIWMRK